MRRYDLRRAIASLLSTALVLSSVIGGAFPEKIYADDSVSRHGNWEISKDDDGVNLARWSGSDFCFHSQSDLDCNSINDIFDGETMSFDYVRTTATNGKQSGGIVSTAGAYCDYEAKASGILSLYVKIASGKSLYVSKTNKDNENSEVGHFTIGTADSYDDYEDISVTPSDSGNTIKVDIDCESGNRYYMAIVGSKMWCYGVEEDMANTELSGEIKGTVDKLPEDYKINFTNEDDIVYEASRSENAYSIVLRPGNYTASIKGAKGYAISTDSKKVTVGDEEVQKHDLEIVESVNYEVSGAIKGIGEDYDLSDLDIKFMPEDTISYEPVKASIDRTKKSYCAELEAGEKYSVEISGAEDYELSTDISVELDSDIEKDIELTLREQHEVSGSFIGLTDIRGEYEKLNVSIDSISFKNTEDSYVYEGSITADGYSAALRNGSYLASIESEDYSTTTHVVVDNGDVSRDILLKKETVEKTEYCEKIYVGESKEYKSIRAAINAAASMERDDDERVTIVIEPGTYREQLYIDTPNITLEGADDSKENTIISWYYGIGYKYYSCVDSLYDPYAEYDAFEKGNVTNYWGATVLTTAKAKGFKAENIRFENSFNKYMTEEELTDGVELNGTQSITQVRRAATDVRTKTATERAAAYVNYADQTEFNNCAFVGSQDTLYTCNRSYDAYYKNCYIEGQTDFIYGNGDVIFDGCEINFCGYTDKAAAGYITANSTSTTYGADNGYIFRSCFISYGDDALTTPGYLGRMWGDSAKVSFINTRLADKDIIIPEGWTSMSGKNPTDETMSLQEYNTSFAGEAVSTENRVAGVVENIDPEDFSVEKIFIEKGWTPSFYSGDAYSKPEFVSDITLTSNGDLNAPNPGETVSVVYELGEEWADEDASVISWYALDTDYDGSSLESALKSAEFLSTSVASVSKSIQIPMSAAGKYLMLVVTAAVNDGSEGEREYIVNEGLAAISSSWSDPSNPDSLSPGSGINIYLAGDSTVKDYSSKGIYNSGSNDPRGSWGEFLQEFFDEKYVTVNNYAQGGRSSRSFINEGKLASIMENIKAGDYLFVQFGHNDEGNQQSYYLDRFAPLWTKGSSPVYSDFPTIKPEESMKTEKPATLTAISDSKYYAWDCGATFKGYLQEYIDEALEKGAIPVIVTPVSRMYYGTDGKIYAHHDATGTDYADTAEFAISKENRSDTYVKACKEIYDENKDKGVLLIDAYSMTRDLFDEAYEACGSSANGEAIMNVSDKTHSNKVGGFIQAALFARWIQDAGLDISNYVEKPSRVYGDDNTDEYIFEVNAEGNFKALDNNHNPQTFWTEIGQNYIDEIAAKREIINSEDEASNENGSEDASSDDNSSENDSTENNSSENDSSENNSSENNSSENNASEDNRSDESLPDGNETEENIPDENSSDSDQTDSSDDENESPIVREDEEESDSVKSGNDGTEEAISSNKPYGQKDIKLEIDGNSVSVRYYEHIPYMAANITNAGDIGLSVSINGEEIPSSAIKVRVKGKKGTGNSYSAEILSIRGNKYKTISKKLKSALRNKSISGTQYALTVKSVVNSKSSASETGQLLLKLSRDKKKINSMKIFVLTHNAKGVEKRKFINVKKDCIENYSPENGIITFKGNLNGSIEISTGKKMN